MVTRSNQSTPIVVLGAALFSLLGVQCGTSVKIDAAIPADLAGDRTLIIRAGGLGCNTSPEVGYAFCRKPEGPVEDIDRIMFYAPRTNCDREYCGLVEIYSAEGSLIHSAKFPKEGGMIAVPWADMLPTSSFRRADNGIYPVLMRLYWKDNDGNERVTGMRGEIRLIVYQAIERVRPGQRARTYEPLQDSPASDVWAFETEDDGFCMKWSTAGRAYVGRCS